MKLKTKRTRREHKLLLRNLRRAFQWQQRARVLEKEADRYFRGLSIAYSENEDLSFENGRLTRIISELEEELKLLKANAQSSTTTNKPKVSKYAKWEFDNHGDEVWFREGEDGIWEELSAKDLICILSDLQKELASTVKEPVDKLATNLALSLIRLTSERQILDSKAWTLLEELTSVDIEYPASVLLGEVTTDIAELVISGGDEDLRVQTGADGTYKIYADNYRHGFPSRIIIQTGGD